MALKAILASLEGLDEHVAALYTPRGDKFELGVEIEGVEGIKTFTDFSRLNEALRKERTDHKAIKERYAPLGERKVEEIVALYDRLPELEAAAAGTKIDDAMIQGLVEGRIKSKLAPIERDLLTVREQNAQLQTTVQGYQAKEVQRTIGDAVRGAAAATKVVETALEDAIMLGERVLTIDENGKVVTKDNVGCTPGISAEVWLNEMQTKRPHWWGPSAGGGAGGSQGRSGTQFATNPWSAEGWNLTQQGQIYTENPAKADQMARSAGTTVGGPRPQRK